MSLKNLQIEYIQRECSQYNNKDNNAVSKGCCCLTSSNHSFRLELMNSTEERDSDIKNNLILGDIYYIVKAGIESYLKHNNFFTKVDEKSLQKEMSEKLGYQLSCYVNKFVDTAMVGYAYPSIVKLNIKKDLLHILSTHVLFKEQFYVDKTPEKTSLPIGFKLL